MKITELLGEATEYDKKQSVERKKPKSWLKTVSAFANTGGGVLIFGVADNDEIARTHEYFRLFSVQSIILNANTLFFCIHDFTCHLYSFIHLFSPS